MTPNNLFDEFPEVSSKAWKHQIQADLKGADYAKSLIWESPEGIKVKPFYNSEDLEAEIPPIPGGSGNWRIGQVIYAGNTRMASAKARDVVARGVETLVFTIPSEEVSIPELVKGIALTDIQIHLDLQFLSSSSYIDALAAVFEGNKNTSLNIDILGHLARSGNWFHSLEQDFTLFRQCASAFHKKAGGSSLYIDGSLYQQAGANMVQQLAYSLAHANEYCNRIQQSDPGSAATHGFIFKLAVGGNYFFEIAKIRALRLLWKTLASSYGFPGECHILALPGLRNKTLYEYNTNMLRTTMECMSAILGGADTICNIPYDAIYHKDNEFGERMARNQLLILKEEAHMDKVANAADGAYYIEKITLQLAEQALALFKDVEAGGGFLQQLREHTIQKKIRESAQREQQLFNRNELVLVGSNAYRNETERMKSEVELHPFLKINARKTAIEPILEKRLAAEQEQKRLKDE